MEQLNDLARLAMRATSDEWTTNDRGGVIAVDDQANDGFVICATSGRDKFHNAEFIAAADPKTILAIAEAYRALEKRLAELEKQEPQGNPVLGYADSYRSMAKAGVTAIPVWSVITDLERNIAPLFTRPAPAINLAELVPDEMTIDSVIGTVTESGHVQAVKWWNACRAAILLNIEKRGADSPAAGRN